VNVLKKWKTVESKLLYSSNFLSISNDTVVLPNGKQITYNTIGLHDFVSVLATIEDKIVIIEILRYPRNVVSLEIPSGHVEEGETPKESAFRELLEETGYSAKHLELMFSYNPLSRSTQKAHLFLAKDLKKGNQMLGEAEQINVKLIPESDVEKLLVEGKITHAPTLLALQRYLLMKAGLCFSVS
jgi:ADP-ribose pyrophosphatase